MINTPERAFRDETLKDISSDLKRLTAAIQEHNRLLQSCILEPEGQLPRLMVGTYGVLEVIALNDIGDA